MEAVDPRTMHVLIRDKNAPKWQDDTWRVAKARRDGKRVVITYTDGKEFPYGEDRVRIYDQVERRSVDGLDEIRVCGQRWNNVEIVWTLRRREDPREPRYTLTYRKSDGTLGTWRYGSGEVRVTYASAQDRQRAATLDYVREEVRAHALRRGEAADERAIRPVGGQRQRRTVRYPRERVGESRRDPQGFSPRSLPGGHLQCEDRRERRSDYALPL